MIMVENVPVQEPRSGRGLICEASTIGLKPGDFPEVLSGLDHAGQPFEFKRDHFQKYNGELSHVVYFGQGWELSVLND